MNADKLCSTRVHAMHENADKPAILFTAKISWDLLGLLAGRMHLFYSGIVFYLVTNHNNVGPLEK